MKVWLTSSLQVRYTSAKRVKPRFLSSRSLGVISFEEAMLAQTEFHKQQIDISPHESINALSTSALKLLRNAVRAAFSSFAFGLFSFEEVTYAPTEFPASVLDLTCRTLHSTSRANRRHIHLRHGHR